jgi:hypothetical protein
MSSDDDEHREGELEDTEEEDGHRQSAQEPRPAAEPSASPSR